MGLGDLLAHDDELFDAFEGVLIIRILQHFEHRRIYEELFVLGVGDYMLDVGIGEEDVYHMKLCT